ncbi:hypothetical protein BCD67_06785 [Oscillatoriales cyanobacterium USR001]|nr:hypothetical protein BCD67_06785 [Oscillatoriales cyanobacterium USR001]
MNYKINVDWEKLAVVDWDFFKAKTNFLTHGLHPYPAKFIPQIPNALIKEFSNPGETVADIFCGSGTTLVEALTLNRNTIGIDANPIACLISEAKTTRFNEQDEGLLNFIVKRAENLANAISIQNNSSLFHSESFISNAYRPQDEAICFWFESFVVEELAEALSWCQELPTETSRKVALAAFSSIVVAVSKQDSDTRYVRRKKKLVPGETLKRFSRALTDSIHAVSELTRLVHPQLKCEVHNIDLLTKPDIGNIDLLVCSPPYPNAYSYHLYHRTRMLWLQMDQAKFKGQEIGSHRKYSSKSSKAATVDTFRRELSSIFEWLREHLRNDRYACFVVGDSIIKGEKVSNDDLIADIANQHNFQEIKRFERRMQDTKKAFNPAIGKIKDEQIVILQKKSNKGNAYISIEQSFPSINYPMNPKPKEYVLKCHIKPYIQPFERQLALAELKALTDNQPYSLPTLHIEPLDFEVISYLPAEIIAQKLSYWENVICEDKSYICTQVIREATVNIARKNDPLEKIVNTISTSQEISIPNRRCLRYGTHGIHEYRGKFFPQLVRALINIAKVPEQGIVADPMSGSGTTVAEAILAGCHAIALDLNPLSVLIGKTKCGLLSLEPQLIIDNYYNIERKLLDLDLGSISSKLSYFDQLLLADQKYLHNWFSPNILFELDRIASLINSVDCQSFQDLMRLSLSNIIRQVSWQKKDDLRVHKEITDTTHIHPIENFLTELERSVKNIVSFLSLNQNFSLGTFNIQTGDAREMNTAWHNWCGLVDVVITSPPYATALPYLDTDRLSLYYLGLMSRSEHRKRDEKMIGNREVSKSKRQSYWQYFQDNKIILPQPVIELIEKIENLNSNAEVGFRRRNLAALLAKYFFDMREVMNGILQILKPGGFAYIVVGNNHTIAGGERVEIETANLLVDIAVSVGLIPGEHLSMEMLISRDISRKNAVASEMILSFRSPF